jgi:hypothetical protein
MRGFDWRCKSAIALLALSVVGCSKPQAPTPTTDTNVYPQYYRKQIAIYLSQVLSDRADFLGARIAQPVLKPVNGTIPHYVVCLQFNGRSQIKDKEVVYFSGDIGQFIDSAPEQCGGAAYQPFSELEQVVPATDNRDAGTMKMGDGDLLQ